MDLHFTEVPLWVSLSFGIFFVLVPPWLLANAASNSLDQGKNAHTNRIKNSILIFYALYFMVVAGLSLSGLFAINSLPPRIILITTLPLFLFYFLYVQQTAWFRSAFEHIRIEQLVYIHLFRFVGIYFILVNAYGVLPDTFAWIGGVGDILTAIFAIPVIYFLRRKAPFANVLAWAWNIFGLVDILSVLSSAIVTTRFAMLNKEAGVLQFGTFPFSWIPAFAPATIVFLHILIFRKLWKKNP